MQTVKVQLISVVLVVVVSLLLPAQAGDLEDGIAAFEADEYDTARQLLMPLAKQGNAKAQYSIGWLYLHGHGVEKSNVEALDWFKKAASQGEERAMFKLGFMYYEGEGVQQDYQEAARRYRKLAEQGYADAQLALGMMHQEGEGVPQDFKEGARGAPRCRILSRLWRRTRLSESSKMVS